MEEKIYTINKPKFGCETIVTASIGSLFSIGVIVVPIINLFYDFSIGSLFASLLMMLIGFGIIYLLFVHFFMKAKVTVNQNGIEVIGWLIHRQNASWSDIESVQVTPVSGTGKQLLTIQKMGAGQIMLPSSERIVDFSDLLNRIADYMQSQKKATQKSSLEKALEGLEALSTFEDDIALIRIYCQHLAKEWWQSNDMETAICDGCNGGVSRDDGVLIGSYLYCEVCADEKFGPSYALHFRTNPNFYGRGILEKAREFVRDQNAK